ncbi:bZIP transcription factor [Sporobolomyces salmoneus]|uniref:bZIP transcription factor n=1 Tax=Sporobolomyces salmoneus TaxID=183962 RepID=UPI00317652E7
MTGTRGKRIKTSDSPSSFSFPIDPALTGSGGLDPASPSFESPNVSPQPHASGSNGGQSTSGSDRAAERKERNRLAAQRSRDKRAAEYQAVVEECQTLRVENEELKIKIEEKDQELRQKDDRIAELELLLANGSANGKLGGGLSDLVHASNFLDQF